VVCPPAKHIQQTAILQLFFHELLLFECSTQSIVNVKGLFKYDVSYGHQFYLNLIQLITHCLVVTNMNVVRRLKYLWNIVPAIIHTFTNIDTLIHMDNITNAKKVKLNEPLDSHVFVQHFIDETHYAGY